MKEIAEKQVTIEDVTSETLNNAINFCNAHILLSKLPYENLTDLFCFVDKYLFEELEVYFLNKL